MKFVIVFSLAFIALVSCEKCTLDTDCTVTQCNGGNRPFCEHPDGGTTPGGGTCTCPATGECVLASDCYGNGSDLPCEDAIRHCYDGKCICEGPLRLGRAIKLLN